MSTSPPPDADADQAQPNTVQVQATEQQLKARAEGVSIEDYLLPRSITLRLAKSVLPPNTSVQKDAVLAIQKAATVFVSYLSSQCVFSYLSPPSISPLATRNPRTTPLICCVVPCTVPTKQH
ncbi:hypothetical protein BDV11DRAFT_183037 [Aspergillus similis]